VSVAWTLAAIVGGLWLLAALLQLGDVATVFLDSRTARDRDIPGRISRERTNELFWVVPVAALVALAVGIGLDQAGRLTGTVTTGGHGGRSDSLAIATLFLLGLAVLVVGIATLTLAAVAATDPISYVSLRREMREWEGERITPVQLDAFNARLARIDRRTRSRMRPKRALLSTPNILRLCAVVLGIVVVVVVAIAQAIHPTAESGALVYVAILAPVLSALFAALAIRFAIASDTAWRRVYARQRSDILKLLDGFERSTRKRVPGLGDRVARALKILGRQQGQ
jgi:hypothetical protein